MYHFAALTDFIVQPLVDWATDVIGALGAWGVFVLMTLESALIPVPSEAIMLFAGFNVFEGKLTLFEIVVAGVAGNVVGSWLAFGLGYFGRIELVERHGKWLHISNKQLSRADRWFEKYGDATVFFSRMLPIIRTFISLPAGVARMPFWRFTVLTTIGCIPWVLMLGLIGMEVGSRWEEWREKLHILDYLVIAGIIVGAVYLTVKWRRNKRNLSVGAESGEAADSAIKGLIEVLQSIDPGGESRAVLPPGHYANVLSLDEKTGIAIATDGVGTKIIVAQQISKFDTIGIDCVAMNVNDLICVGARPLALVDYLAVEETDAEMLRQIALGLKAGAEEAGVEIPGGELAQVSELIRGHPSPYGFDLVGTGFGTVTLESVIAGKRIAAGDVIVGLPSSGIHSNGLTLARKALLEQAGYTLSEKPQGLEGTLGEELIKPTEIYVNAVLDLLDSDADVRGLAHITGGGFDNLLRLNDRVGYRVSDPLPAMKIFRLIQEAGSIASREMYRVFNMGTGFCCIVGPGDLEDALKLLQSHYPEARAIGTVTDTGGEVTVHDTGGPHGNAEAAD